LAQQTGSPGLRVGTLWPGLHGGELARRLGELVPFCAADVFQTRRLEKLAAQATGRPAQVLPPENRLVHAGDRRVVQGQLGGTQGRDQGRKRLQVLVQARNLLVDAVRLEFGDLAIQGGRLLNLFGRHRRQPAKLGVVLEIVETGQHPRHLGVARELAQEQVGWRLPLHQVVQPSPNRIGCFRQAGEAVHAGRREAQRIGLGEMGPDATAVEDVEGLHPGVRLPDFAV